jgi:hypothetical protein
MRQAITDNLIFIVGKTGITQILNEEYSEVNKVMSLCLTMHHAIRTCGEVAVYIHIFLTSALIGSGQRHDPAALPQGKLAPGPTGH